MLKKEIWEIIPWLEINGKPALYPVLNERAVRVTAGIMFAIWFFTLLTTLHTKDYFLMHSVVVWFFIDFGIKVFWWPKYSPLSCIARWLVRKQTPEYVWAIQKRFAWAIGLAMSGLVAILTIGFGIYGYFILTLCILCLAFMCLESSVWYCVWCTIYALLLKKWILKTPENKPKCAGDACEM
jgi:hypothetical protein